MSTNTPSPTIVVTDTDRLSAVADAILARAGNPKLTKNTVLNLIAGTLAGAKTNWGGLKAMPSPVRGTSLTDEALSAARVLLLDDEEEEKLPCRIEGTSLVFDFQKATSLETYKVAVALTDVPAIMEALFDEYGVGEYTTTHLTIGNWHHGQIVAETRFFDGTPGEICFDRALFEAFLLENRETILDIIVADDSVGQTLHGAFIMTEEGNTDDTLLDIASEFPDLEEAIQDEGAEANAARIDHACREAVWLFLAQATDRVLIRNAIRRGPQHEMVDLVADHEWTLVGEALRNALEAEAAG